MKSLLTDSDHSLEHSSTPRRCLSNSKSPAKIYDRHITRVNPHRYTIAKCTATRKESPKCKSYQKCLQETFLENQSVRDYTLDRTASKEASRRHMADRVERKQRIEPRRSYKVAGWKDNFYTSLLDWSYSNFICAAYGTELFFYNMAHEEDFEGAVYRRYFVPTDHQHLTSVKFSPYETKIALGYSNGDFKLYDYLKEKTIFENSRHSARISVIEWNSGTIFSGSRDKKIYSLDPRTGLPSIQIDSAHQQEVCGIKERGKLLASGGNDNNVCIYDLRHFSRCLDQYSHFAAVKAITWLKQGKLVTGGGTADKKLIFWSEEQGKERQVDTGSQVCGLVASKHTNELVSCQGFSLNQIVIWTDKGERVSTIHGHTSRVLYSALSPNGEKLATGAGDQTLKLWKLFPEQPTDGVLSYDDIR